jgi:peptidoglycan/LPS O-acetylase OafA/YrhL
MSLNRFVALLTPLVFAPLAGFVSTWAAEHMPGVDIPPDKLEQVFIAGALIALAPAAQWLHGWQKHEAREAAALAAAATGFGAVPVAMAAEPAPPLEDEVGMADEDVEEDVDELEDLDDFDEFEDTSVLESEDESVPAGS